MSDQRDLDLERGREHCFLAGIGDVGEKLCAANMPYGIAKIHHAQKELGFAPDATFVGAPDATVTRNVPRWNQGFGYGGRLKWSGDFAVLDIKSNGCGMLAGKLPSIPEQSDLLERTRSLLAGDLELEGIPVEYDLHEGNHFLDLCETTGGEEADEASWFVMHSSGHEHRVTSPFGCGIYYDACDELMARARVLDTPWGTLHILVDEDAEWFYGSYMKVQEWNHRRRSAIATHLFGEFDEVINATHQGLTAMNEAHLGCYVFTDEELAAGIRFPLTISADLPLYMVAPKANFTPELADKVGFLERAERHGVRDRVVGANLLPHGGGYKYPHFEGVAKVHEDGPDQRRFEMLKTDGTTEIIVDPKSQAFGYRGMEIVGKLDELELGRTVVEMKCKYVLRD